MTAYISMFVQIITAIISVYGLFIPLNFKDIILREILILELIVQIIEFIFYIWLIITLQSINEDITYVRYFDLGINNTRDAVDYGVFFRIYELR